MHNKHRFAQGRVMSSYASAEETPKNQALMADLRKNFAVHSQAGVVRFEYDTRMYYGQMAQE